MTRTALAFALSTAAFAASAQSPHAAHAATASAPTASDVPLDAALIATLPQVSVSGNAHGKAVQCDGVALVDLLRASKAMPEAPLRGTQLAKVVVVSARDGYRAAYSLAELDPTLGNRTVVLTQRCNGIALDNEDGPWRLVAPQESRPARWVRQVESIRVVDAP